MTQPSLRAEPKSPSQSPSVARLFMWIAPTTFALALVWGAVPSVLIALQVQHTVGDSAKAGTLAIVLSIGAVFSILVPPIAGLISDRTRSRWGRRSQWIVSGSLVGALSLIVIGTSTSIAQLTLGWCLTVIGFNVAQTALLAIMPDRIKVSRRGTFAALSGLGFMTGSLGGQVFASAVSHDLVAGYALLAIIVFLTLSLFAILARGESTANEPRKPINWHDFVGAFWVSPTAHPDFAWVLTSRLLIYLGYYLVFGYKLYLLQDYAGFGKDAIHMLPLLGGFALVGIVTDEFAETWGTCGGFTRFRAQAGEITNTGDRAIVSVTEFYPRWLLTAASSD